MPYRFTLAYQSPAQPRINGVVTFDVPGRDDETALKNARAYVAKHAQWLLDTQTDVGFHKCDMRGWSLRMMGELAPYKPVRECQDCGEKIEPARVKLRLKFCLACAPRNKVDREKEPEERESREILVFHVPNGKRAKLKSPQAVPVRELDPIRDYWLVPREEVAPLPPMEHKLHNLAPRVKSAGNVPQRPFDRPLRKKGHGRMDGTTGETVH